MEYSEEDYLMISGIQHFNFCRRQWAIIHIEQQWVENILTIEGNLMHKNAHDGLSSEKRSDIIISRGMKIFSKILGIYGVCDIVEFQRDDVNGVEIFGYPGKYNVIPIEYKRGNPKTDDSDNLQLAAQAICLEEMLCCDIPYGYMFYGETKHRFKVDLDNRIRENLREVTKEMHKHYDRLYTPKVKPDKKCKSCSLKEICLPKLYKNQSVSSYIERMINDGGEET